MRDCEETAYIFFVNYLEDCEGESNKFHVLDYFYGIIICVGSDTHCVTLQKILLFYSGSDSIPPLGYSAVTLTFSHDNIYPTASTCVMELTLPAMHKEYVVFKKHLYTGLTMNGGFGLV